MSSSSKEAVWQDYREEALEKCVLPMTDKSHKGSSGRVGVLGGSARYTGAPYYAAMSCLKAGADLAYVFCAEEAAMPIKCYSPELMVTPVYNAAKFDKVASTVDEESYDAHGGGMVTEVVSMMDRMHVLVVGPGLGRCPVVMHATATILKAAMARNLALVLDADALFLLTTHRDLLHGSSKVVLTPNAMEYKRLIQAEVLPPDDANDFFGFKKGPIVVQKGLHDVVTQLGEEQSARQITCMEEGGLKRSGGLGDLLAGTLGTFVAWNQILVQRGQPTDLVLACWSACSVIKRATKVAFDDKRRAMTAPDVLEVIGPAMDEMTS